VGGKESDRRGDLGRLAQKKEKAGNRGVSSLAGPQSDRNETGHLVQRNNNEKGKFYSQVVAVIKTGKERKKGRLRPALSKVRKGSFGI